MKHVIVIFLLLITASTTTAQRKENVLLYRRDGISPLYKKAIVFFNDSMIYQHKRNFIFFDNLSDCGGTYSWGISKEKQAHVFVKGGESPLSLIEIRVKGDWLYNGVLVMRKVSPSEFRKHYNRKKWLRNKLSDAGYSSVDQLFDEYKVIEK
jgi:hypothetical protein